MAHFAIQEYKYRKNWIVSQIGTLVVYICIEIMKERYRNEIEWWFVELGSESEIDKSLVLFPELNSRLPKIAIGIY